MRNFVIVAIAAISLVNVVTPAGAYTEVRDHRQPPVVRDHREPTEVRDHRQQPEVRDHRGDNEGQSRPKKEKACLLGLVCTSNKTVVGIVDKSIPRPIIPR